MRILKISSFGGKCFAAGADNVVFGGIDGIDFLLKFGRFGHKILNVGSLWRRSDISSGTDFETKISVEKGLTDCVSKKQDKNKISSLLNTIMQLKH